jgi:DNA repair protein RadA/Sms
MNKPYYKTVFVCQNCGRESPKWLGRCPECQQWDTFVEKRLAPSTSHYLPAVENPARELAQLTAIETPRLVTPFLEFNRVLGGGLVPGSLVLISGDPGIGKSTLLLQVSASLARQGDKILYVSGEESLQQTKLRAERFGIKGERLYLLSENNLEAILHQLEEISPNLAIIDSIQSVYSDEVSGAPGSVSQIREGTLRLMHWAKNNNVPLLITGHVTKEGTIAGPKILEHIVDVVLYLEGETFNAYRLLRGVKNRFGSTNEVGVFEMSGAGMMEIANPSEIFLPQRFLGRIGSAITAILEGTRPLLVEIQSLTTPTAFGLPRRTANGIDFNRLLLIVAVLTKRVGLRLGNQDIIVNVAGGLKIAEPAADLAVALAIASSLSDRETAPDLITIGEIGLSGEIRAVPQLERRITEASREGFTQCIIPKVSSNNLTLPPAIELLPAESLKEAIRLGLKTSPKTHPELQ